MRYFLIITLLSACIGDINRQATDFPDNRVHDFDGDGLSELDGDCNDMDKDVLTAAMWYADADEDGFGDVNVTLESCDQPDGYVDNAEDCDDSASETYPGSSRDGMGLCVRDLDGDGYGDVTATIPFDAGTDCNDSDSSIFPNNARYEADELCVVDSDGDGYGDALPSVNADPGRDCDDSNPLVYPGYNQEVGELCVLDNDGDGFGVGNAPQPYDSGTDCDDSNPEIHPQMIDICDGIDNDCSNEIDDYAGANAPLWYNDDDGDGFGNAGLSIRACNQPPSHVSDATDCDDSDATVYPGAPEYCNGLDNNCNTVIDDNSAIDALPWYADADSDGYGGAGTVSYACTQPSGFVGNATDCNDLSAQQYPGAPEICNGEDDSCDGIVDEGVQNTYYIDADGDGFGNILQTALACAQQPGTVSDFSDCDDTDPLVNPNAPEYCNLRDDDCDGQEDEDSIDSTTFYIDNDGDGRGTDSQTLDACPLLNGVPTAPEGYSFYDDDCDDQDATRAPNLMELCTSTIDENCDGDNILGAIDLTTFYADGDGDGQGNPIFTVQLCAAPYGYVDNSFDCNDTDPNVLSGMPEAWEICNGKLDRCEEDDGILTPPAIERDEDNDGFVDCVLDVDPLQWEDPNATRPLGEIQGGDCGDDNPDVFPGNCPLETDPTACYMDADLDGYGDPNPPLAYTVSDYTAGLDCEDDNAFAFPDAPELCNGIAEDCDDPNYGGSPDLEVDNDGDGYVECSGYDPSTWQGDGSVIGGGDCQDGSELIYTGAAVNHPDVCAQDSDNDGEPDCNLTGINPSYSCDFGLFLPVGIGPDFMHIPAGDDPLGRYSISYDFYMMTTELLSAQYQAIISGTAGTSYTPVGSSDWLSAAYLAHQLSALMGVEQCYDCPTNQQSCSVAVEPTECTGYRLPTEWEWEYAARSGTTKDVWTGAGPDLGGNLSSNVIGCNELVVLDGVGNPSLQDYAWFCMNNQSGSRKMAAQKLPNGFGLYDMHGNMDEWTEDIAGIGSPSGVDPWSGYLGLSSTNRYYRGGNYRSAGSLGASSRSTSSQYDDWRGFRLVIRVP